MFLLSINYRNKKNQTLKNQCGFKCICKAFLGLFPLKWAEHLYSTTGYFWSFFLETASWAKWVFSHEGTLIEDRLRSSWAVNYRSKGPCDSETQRSCVNSWVAWNGGKQWLEMCIQIFSLVVVRNTLQVGLFNWFLLLGFN